MDALLDQVKQSVTTIDDRAKKALILKLRDLANSLETPDGTLDRISFGVSHVWQLKRPPVQTKRFC
jgi:hypothetical protein